MAKNYNTSCDNCGRILYGQDRGAFIREDNIFFNGQAGKNVVDHKTGYHETVYFTRTNAEQTCFCNPECINEWMVRQEEHYQNRKQAKLREEVEAGITGQEPRRMEAVYSVPDAPKPPRREFGTAPAKAPTKEDMDRFGTEPPKHIGYGG